MNYPFGKESGSILVMVLWVLALLAMISAYYASQTRIMRNVAQYSFQSIQGREAARSVLRLVAPRIRIGNNPGQKNPSDETGPQFTTQRIYSMQVGPLNVEFSLDNEAGKIDLNKVEEGFLREFLRYLLGPENLKIADTICDSILDWRDTDKLSRVNGAEDDVYKKKVPPYHAANGPFRTINELLLVNGVTQKLFYGPIYSENISGSWDGGLRDLFTIYNRQKEVNPDEAPPPIKAFMEEKGIKGQDRLSNTWLLRLKAASHVYRIFWQKKGNKDFMIVFWSEGVGH